jgi:hypothetical protein
LLLLLVVLQTSVYGVRSLTVGVASWAAQFVGGLALFVALLGKGGAERRPWMLFGRAVVTSPLADVVWVGTRTFRLGLAETLQVTGCAISYVLLFELLFCICQEEVSVAALVPWRSCLLWGF